MNDAKNFNSKFFGPDWRSAPLWRLVVSQIVGGLIAFSASALVTLFVGNLTPVFAVLFASGIFAAWIGYRLGLAIHWIPLQIFLIPTAAFIARLGIPAWVFLLVFSTLTLVFWNSARSQVPLYLTNRKTWRVLTTLVAHREPFSFVDLGCGIGGTLLYLAAMRPDARFTGIESAPIPFLIAWLRTWLNGLPNVKISYGDIWKENLGNYDVVYVFLSPIPMPRLTNKTKTEMQKGSLFISNSFTDPASPPDETVTVDDRRQTQLHLWRQ